MSLIVNGTTIEHVIINGLGVSNHEIDYIVANGTTVFESTQYVEKPTISNTSKTYSGSVQAPTITGYDATAMTQSGDASATNAGTYTVTYTLKQGYAWTDKTTAAVSLTWSIGKMSLTIPSLSNASKTYNGNAQAPTISGYNSTYETQSGTASATNYGTYTVTWSLKSTANTQWTDGTTAAKSATWNIKKLSLTIPSLSGTLTQTFIEGTTRSVSVSGFNSTYETQSGTTSTSALGSYTVTWTLKSTSNTQWSDGTTAAKTGTWSIVWVNGTSHYSSDLYNKGWYNSGLDFQYGVTWNSDSFTISGHGGGTAVVTVNSYASKTFHAIVSCSSSVTLVECPTGSYSRRTITTITPSGWQEISGAHLTADYPRFGLANGAVTFSVQRIWIT